MARMDTNPPPNMTYGIIIHNLSWAHPMTEALEAKAHILHPKGSTLSGEEQPFRKRQWDWDVHKAM